ncbi:MAG: NAD(P)/FAD-dependent oxidoreductase [Actinomycetes bacterium]
MSSEITTALADAAPVPFWLDTPVRPAARVPLTTALTTDLLVVGGGFSGLWTALLAKEADPGREVVLLEGGRIAWGASGRNGGFAAASLTHGLANGGARYPSEMPTLLALGRSNLEAIGATIDRYGIECGWEATGELDVATEAWQLAELAEQVELAGSYGVSVELVDAAAVRQLVNSPTYLGGVLDRQGVAMVDPARLAFGLAAAAEAAGVHIAEHSPVRSLDEDGARVVARTHQGSVRARRVALGTNAFPPLLRRISAYIVPVYDYVLVTEPLSAAQRAAIGWASRVGVGDSGNQFHYYRLTADDRILWGGYDAVYRYGSRMRPQDAQRPATARLLAEHFFATFPALAGVRFTHSWGGAIDTCTRFSPFWGRAMGGKVGYVAGYTGLGVGASRFGAAVLLDLLDGRRTARTALSMVARKPLPFPPEPARWLAIQATRRSLARADRNGGQRDRWLRTLDRLGLGFDS